jgi:hypothetical protein
MKIHLVLAAAFAALSAAAAFKEGKTAIPAEWKGKSVRYEQKLGFCEVDVMVNGKKAGTAYAPDGTVELAPYLRFGVENEITTVERKADAYYGRGDEPSGARRDGKHRLSAAELVPRTAAWIDDFFARPSWREKKLFVDVEIESLSREDAVVEVELSDAQGMPVLKRAKKAARLEKGSNVVKVELPWTDDIVAWEPVAGAKTYDCLYFSHADGREADISSSNLYFNFTPLQEREEWLSQWATNGILPWYAAEFGAASSARTAPPRGAMSWRRASRLPEQSHSI